MVHFTPAQLDKVNFSMAQFLIQHEHCNTNEDMAFGQSDHCSRSVTSIQIFYLNKSKNT